MNSKMTALVNGSFFFLDLALNISEIMLTLLFRLIL